MKKHLINAFVAAGLLATLNSCSKDEQFKKPETTAFQETSSNSASVNANITLYTTVNKEFLQNSLMKLDKYKNKQYIDSLCNKELAIQFLSLDGTKAYPRLVVNTTKWGNKPYVTNENPTFLIDSYQLPGKVLTMKLSKKVTEFGFEYYTKYIGFNYTVTQSIWDYKTKTMIGNGHFLHLNQTLPNNSARFGGPSGAVLFGIKSDVPFDEIRISIDDPKGQPMPRINQHFITGIRYKIAK